MEDEDVDLQEFEDWMYGKFSRSTIEVTSRKISSFPNNANFFQGRS